jgi:hypothetical protein
VLVVVTPHIVHNCIQTATDVLPIEVEALVVKIYKYFHIYTVHVTQLKEFCEFVDLEYKKVLQHGNTRFLSLLPAIERILQIYEGLVLLLLSRTLPSDDKKISLTIIVGKCICGSFMGS